MNGPSTQEVSAQAEEYPTFPRAWVRGTMALARQAGLLTYGYERDSSGLPAVFRRSGLSARASRRIQQRPCAGFSPASLFIPPRERAEPVGAWNHNPFLTEWPEGSANHRRILRAITARFGIAPFWRRNSVGWEAEAIRSYARYAGARSSRRQATWSTGLGVGSCRSSTGRTVSHPLGGRSAVPQADSGHEHADHVRATSPASGSSHARPAPP